MAQLCLLACNRQSYSDYPPEPDASGHDSSSGSSSGVFGDDSSIGDEFILGESGGSSGGNCSIPSGTYTLTTTPGVEAGASCTGSTSTVTFPMATVDGGPSCTYTPNGSPPSCAVSFTCTTMSNGETTTASGFIDVISSSIGGSETVVVTDTASTQVISTCNFTLGYVKQ